MIQHSKKIVMVIDFHLQNKIRVVFGVQMCRYLILLHNRGMEWVLCMWDEKRQKAWFIHARYERTSLSFEWWSLLKIRCLLGCRMAWRGLGNRDRPVNSATHLTPVPRQARLRHLPSTPTSTIVLLLSVLFRSVSFRSRKKFEQELE